MSVPGPDQQRPEWAMSEEHILEEMNKIPLFMNNLPEDSEENATLLALQSLAYDGTAEEVAENFKNQGNDCFKEGKHKYQDAIKFYTQALETECGDKNLMAICYTNRAAVNLELENYGRVLNDCAAALGINPKNVKALYRSARALRALEKYLEAIDCCDWALKFEPNNKSVAQEKQLCIKQKEEKEKKELRRQERERLERERKDKIDQAIKLRNIQLESNLKLEYDWQNDSPHSVTLNEESGELTWPVFFLYPEYKESDFISAFDETNTFMDHLEVMFEQPAPWDTSRVYKPSSVEVFFEYHPKNATKASLIKVGKKCALMGVLGHSKYVVQNGIPSFLVVPSSGSFHDEFLAKYKN
ncbi:HSP70/90 co-chaperone [Basidiobolus ranarum]|uniref:HSP70/90 co-chaperone n=1 Tax=Basidiobolus ranarum TaxID=34480 RepID=A0ABR2W9J6_9FUNG